jgi:hypothetical protein
MIIGIDLDDVVVNFIDTFMKMSYDKFGRPSLGTKPIDWEWSNVELSQVEIGSLWKDISDSENFWEKLPIDPGASMLSMHKLKNIADLVFITARNNTKGNPTQYQCAKWLDFNFGLSYPTVIVDKNKGPIAAALKLDYFIDDRPKNCWEIQDAVPTCKVFLKDACHNLNFNLGYRPLPRVRDFDTFANLVYEENS